MACFHFDMVLAGVCVFAGLGFFSCLIISSIVTADENVHFKLDLARLQYGPRCSCLVLCIFFNSIKCPEKVRKYNV